jgi:serine protease inhibitor ecotin
MKKLFAAILSLAIVSAAFAQDKATPATPSPKAEKGMEKKAENMEKKDAKKSAMKEKKMAKKAAKMEKKAEKKEDKK